MKVGKLSGEELKKYVLENINPRRAEVTHGSTFGSDFASFELDGTVLIHTDPITGEARDIGSLAVKVAANDIVAAGGEPVLVLLTVILPCTSNVEEIGKIMRDANAEAALWNMEIAGGHTEFSTAVNRPVVNAVAVGKASGSYRPSAPQIGDKIVITKSIALEGSAILADSYSKKLNLSDAEAAEAEGYKKLTGIRAEGAAAVKCNGVRLMHDVTEGGVYGAIAELCEGVGCGAELNKEAIPISPLTAKICTALKVDPYRLVSSGSLLIVTAEAQILVEELAKSGVKGTVIGQIVAGAPRVKHKDDTTEYLRVTPDELFLIEGEER